MFTARLARNLSQPLLCLCSRAAHVGRLKVVAAHVARLGPASAVAVPFASVCTSVYGDVPHLAASGDRAGSALATVRGDGSVGMPRAAIGPW